MPSEERENAVLIVSAHSLPEKIVEMGDPYPEQQRISEADCRSGGCKRLRRRLAKRRKHPDPWLGPDVQDLTRDLSEQKGYSAFVYAPVGFVADHLEVLYDNDYECKVVTDDIGASYYRTEMPNAKHEFIDALADVVLKQLEKEQ